MFSTGKMDLVKGFLALWLVFLLEISVVLTKNILILGGNGFLGSETLELLSEKEHEITIVNRGNNYYGSASRIEGTVKSHIICDRDTLIRKTCPELKNSEKYDAVIDFSSYSPLHMESMIDMLKGRVSLYVFISTDAVYEVCEKSVNRSTVESDGVRPTENILRDKLASYNKYGDQKLACEEALQEQRARGGFPYVILRLADALGPRDTTMRLWTYQVWMKLHQQLNLPIHLPHSIQNKSFSFVFSKDVAKAISNVLSAGKDVHDKTINLAQDESLTLLSLLNFIANYLGVKEINFNENDESAWYRFPTVDLGPLNTDLAKELIDWRPISLAAALNETLDFNEDAMVEKKFAKEREMVLAGFVEDILLEELKDDDILERKLVEAYGPSVLEGIDLGLEVDPEQPQIPDAHQDNEEAQERYKQDGSKDYIDREKVISQNEKCSKDVCPKP